MTIDRETTSEYLRGKNSTISELEEALEIVTSGNPFDLLKEMGPETLTNSPRVTKAIECQCWNWIPGLWKLFSVP